MDKKILIYCRVSTQQQTTDRQKEELLKFAEDNHWNVAEEDIFIDVISGFKKGEFPDSMKIDSLLQITDYEKVKLENGRVIKQDPRIMLSCSAVAKGYSVDVIARLLDRKGIKN